MLHTLTFREMFAHEFLIAFRRFSAQSPDRFQVTAAQRFHCRTGSSDGARHSADAIRNRLKNRGGEERKREREQIFDVVSSAAKCSRARRLRQHGFPRHVSII